MDSRCLQDLDHLGNRNRRPRAARSGRLYIGFRGDLNPVDTSNPSSNLYLVQVLRTLVYLLLVKVLRTLVYLLLVQVLRTLVCLLLVQCLRTLVCLLLVQCLRTLVCLLLVQVLCACC